MIRKAEYEDIPVLVEKGRAFHAMSPHKGMAEYDGEAIARMLAFLIENPAGLLLINETGMIGGMIAPVYFNPAKMMMEESFWWAKGGGMDLLDAFCREARLMGADFVMLSTLENEHSDRIGRKMTETGFSPFERRYVKELI